MTQLDENGKPLDKSYLECNLPTYLQKDIDALIEGRKDKTCLHIDCLEDEVYGDINACYVDGVISEEQAWYLREKYLGMERV